MNPPEPGTKPTRNRMVGPFRMYPGIQRHAIILAGLILLSIIFGN